MGSNKLWVYADIWWKMCEKADCTVFLTNNPSVINVLINISEVVDIKKSGIKKTFSSDQETKNPSSVVLLLCLVILKR